MADVFRKFRLVNSFPIDKLLIMNFKSIKINLKRNEKIWEKQEGISFNSDAISPT